MPDFREYVRNHMPPLGLGGAREAEIAEEVALELEERYERAVECGATSEGAWEQVRRDIAWHDLANELRMVLHDDSPSLNTHPERKSTLFSQLAQDVRFSFRTLAKAPVFLAAAVLTIALGIGPNTAIFSVLYGVFWAPIGPPNGARVSVLWSRHGDEKGYGAHGAIHVSPRELLEWQRQSTMFETFGAVQQRQVNLNDDTGYPERIQVQAHTPGFIGKLYGEQLELGRDFLPEEGIDGNQHVVILQNKFWRERYNSDRSILGKKVRLDGLPYIIVGVMKPGWWDRRKEPMWPALAISQAPREIDQHVLTVLAARKPGVTILQAQAELDAIAQRLAKQYPDTEAGWTARVEPFRNNWLNDRTRTNLGLLMGTVSLVLLIACVNVANLLLARGAVRAPELAVRASMGASTSQVFRLLLTESLILSALGGLAGASMSWVLLKIFRSLLPPFAVPPSLEIGISGSVLLFAMATTAAAGLIFGCVPAWRFARRNSSEALKQSSRAGFMNGRHRLGQALVIAEFALALTLLMGGGMVLRRYWSRTHLDLGVRTQNILTFEIPRRRGQFQTPEQAGQYSRILMEKLQAVPGVIRVSTCDPLPLAPGWGQAMFVAARPPADLRRIPQYRVRSVGPAFFDTFGVRTVMGRSLSAEDRLDTMSVAMVNQSFVRTVMPGLAPLAQELILPGVSVTGSSQRLRIVGVYHDILNSDVYGENPQPEVIVSQAQQPAGFGSIAVATSSDPLQLRKEIAAAVHSLDSEAPLANVRTMEQIVSEAAAFDRFEAALYGSFAALALLLAAVGIYGLMAFAVSQRTSEVGLRLALGATRASVLGLIMRDGLKLTVFGLVAGGAGAWYASRFLQNSLYGASILDPLAMACVAAILVGASVVACLLPAARAAAVDPMRCLRSE